MILDKTSAAKAFSAMKHLLACMRGHNDVPLSYVIRKNLLPPDWGPADPKHQTRIGHPTSPYASVDDDPIAHAPILN